MLHDLTLQTTADVKNSLVLEKGSFLELAAYFRYTGKTAKTVPSPQDFFKIWLKFLQDFDESWRKEQRAAAKILLEKARATKQAVAKQESGRKMGDAKTLGSRLKHKFGFKRTPAQNTT